MDSPKQLIPILCTNCGRKIGEASIKEGKISIKCKCGTLNIVETKPTPSGKDRQ